MRVFRLEQKAFLSRIVTNDQNLMLLMQTNQNQKDNGVKAYRLSCKGGVQVPEGYTKGNCYGIGGWKKSYNFSLLVPINDF